MEFFIKLKEENEKISQTEFSSWKYQNQYGSSTIQYMPFTEENDKTTPLFFICDIPSSVSFYKTSFT